MKSGQNMDLQKGTKSTGNGKYKNFYHFLT